MEKSYWNQESGLRVIEYGLSNKHQISLIASDKRILCYRRWQDKQWEPVYTDNQPVFTEGLGLVAAINRL